jgi:hypothetical protein
MAAESVDYPPAHKADIIPQGLRDGLQALGREPCFSEHMAFDIGGNGCTCQVAMGPLRSG